MALIDVRGVMRAYFHGLSRLYLQKAPHVWYCTWIRTIRTMSSHAESTAGGIELWYVRLSNEDKSLEYRLGFFKAHGRRGIFVVMIEGG